MIKKLFLSFIFLSFISLSINAQYCLPIYSNACSSNDFINNFSTTGGVANITNNGTGCNGSLPNNYIFNSSMAVSQIQGLQFNFSVQSGTQWSQGFRIWIDWNQDLDFADPSEDVFVSASTGTTVQTGTISVPLWAVPGPTRMRVLCRFANIPTITDYCGTTFSFGECEDYVMNVIAATPCTGTPNAGSATPTSASLCAGQTVNIGTVGATYQGNMSYQWQQSTNGGATWINALGGNGATSPFFQTPTLSSSIQYRVIFTCNGSGLSDTSSVSSVIITGPTYGNIPFLENFETWDNYCNTKDVPKATSTLYYSSSPSTGNNSWRRNDQGASANWTNSSQASYIPGSSLGQYSARFHSSNTSSNGNLDLYLDLSQQLGNKTLFFDYINNNINGGVDYLEVLLSQDGGLTFTSQGTYNNSTTWQNFSLFLNSNSPNSVIRFKAFGDFGGWFSGSDIGIDNISVVPDCAGTPVAGVIDSITACPNVPFNLTLTGSSLAGSLTYTWESATSLAGPWNLVNITGAPMVTTQLATPSYFRCIVTCFTSNLTDTTAPFFVDFGSFYLCYCNSQSTALTTLQNIGNVTLKNAQNATILNNGIATPLLSNPTSLQFYTPFYSLTPTNIYRDSTYDISVTAFSQDAFFDNGYSNIYIDFNRDGSFDPILELAAGGVVNAPSNQMLSSFTVPSNAQIGITGMRVVYLDSFGVVSSSNLSPCGPYMNGETEDYLVDISLAPCKTPPNAGTAIVDEPITCPGYSVFLTDTTHDLIFAGLTFNWQVSTDGVNYNDIPGAVFDTLTYVVNSNTWFRFKTTCNGTSNGYSNAVTVTMSPPFACYGNSQAIGGILDSSDIGAFMIKDYSTNNNIYAFVTGGPHLNNPLSVKKRSDYTSIGAMELYTDSTYKMAVYHIMRSLNHADAKVTIFIDYNNNQQYDIPSERVFSGLADVNNFYLLSQIKTPTNPALNVGTGLRVILNNNTNNNTASDNGVGKYTSGETEDYLVKFKLKPLNPNSIDNYNFIQEIGVFPNPATNKVFVGFKTIENTDTKISILSLTGATLLEKQYNNINGNFVTEIDLGNFAKGTYFIQINSEKGKYVRKLIIE